jgi:hypothetical protein
VRPSCCGSRFALPLNLTENPQLSFESGANSLAVIDGRRKCPSESSNWLRRSLTCASLRPDIEWGRPSVATLEGDFVKFKRVLTRTAGLSVVMCLAIANDASAATDKLPNLTPMKASGITIATAADGSKQLRFNTTSWNNGAGPLEIRGGAVDTSTSKQQVLQRIYATDGTYRDVTAGFFEYHPTHNHMHFDNYAVYTLQPVNAPGASARTGTKTTFCILDTDRVNVKLPGASKKAVYKTCGSSVQGMSVGWGDTYGSYLDGQSIDISGIPDGDYNLNIEVDPKAQIVESNESDNTSSVGIRIVGQTGTVL